METKIVQGTSVTTRSGRVASKFNKNSLTNLHVVEIDILTPKKKKKVVKGKKN